MLGILGNRRKFESCVESEPVPVHTDDVQTRYLKIMDRTTGKNTFYFKINVYYILHFPGVRRCLTRTFDAIDRIDPFCYRYTLTKKNEMYSSTVTMVFQGASLCTPTNIQALVRKSAVIQAF